VLRPAVCAGRETINRVFVGRFRDASLNQDCHSCHLEDPAMMTHLPRPFVFLFALSLLSVPTRVAADDKLPQDSRLTKIRTLDDKDFDMKVPATKEEWEKRKKELREQVLVSQGLWPMPEKTPLNPVVHGKIERDDYTIEKVFFASCPGHYVSGHLYVPN